ncbi:integrase, catalytic region, zinc finger, CCHC-type containing protein [Tanacetum coccineum]
MNMGQDRQIQMVGGNGGNQFRQYDRQNVGNQNGYNAVQNVRNQNPNGNGNVVVARAEDSVVDCSKGRSRNPTPVEEFDLMAAAADLDEIEEVNVNCILMANLQQASTSGTQTDKAPVYDSDGSAEVHHYDNCYNNDIFNMVTQEEQYTKLLKPIPELHQVQQNDSNVIFEVSSMEQSGGMVDQHPVTVEETQAAKFVRDFKSLAKEADESLAKHNALELEIERLLRVIVSQDILSIVQSNSVINTSNLQTELDRTKEQFENSYNDMQQKIEWLQAQLGDHKGKSKDTPCVSNTLDPLSQKLENENVKLENKPLSCHSIPKIKDPSQGVNNSAKAIRPQPRRNTKNDRVPSASKSSCIKNQEVKVEEHRRNLPLFMKKKHMSSECNNFKLAIWNAKYEVVCAINCNGTTLKMLPYIHRRFDKIPYELINGRKLDISFLHVFEALCYPKNDREDIGKVGVKGDIGFFIGYSANSCAYRVYNRRTKKIIETMNVTFDELSAMAFE